jgi:uncharacterized surface protein with fasciclin (FAS1) repeats
MRSPAASGGLEPKEMAHVQNSDIHATNGVIHVIDKVILP